MTSLFCFIGITVVYGFGVFFLSARQRAQAQSGAPPAPRTMNRGCLPLLLGLMLICVVIGWGIPTWRQAQNELSFVENNQPVPRLGQAQLGTRVVLQGAVSPDAPVAKWGFVAFERVERQNRSTRLVEERKPSFTLALPGQPAQIENPADPAGASYDFENAASHPQSERIRRLRPNDRVVAIGTVRSGKAGLYLDADDIYVGDYPGYLASRRANLSQNGMATMVILGGIGFCLVMSVIAWRKSLARQMARKPF